MTESGLTSTESDPLIADIHAVVRDYFDAIARGRKLSDMENETVTRGSGNIFADIGLPNAEELFAKAHIESKSTMIGMTLDELTGGEPVEIEHVEVVEEKKPIFWIHVPAVPAARVVEKVMADTAHAALDHAKTLIGDVEGMFVTGPHDKG